MIGIMGMIIWDEFISGLTAVVLAGGFGTRLRAEVPDLPKPLAEVAGRPFLTYLFDQLISWGVRRAVLSTGYKGESISDRFGSAYAELSLDYSHETEPLGTGGALRLAASLDLGDCVLVMNGDSICQLDFRQFAEWTLARDGAGGVLLTEVDDGARYGQVETDEGGRIIRFREKSAVPGRVLINAGVYLLRHEAIMSIPERRRVSLEKDMFPRWIDEGLIGFPGGGKFIDIGVPADYHRAATVLHMFVDT